MNLHRSVRTSIRALFAHKVRAILALSAVTIGVMAVVLTSAIGAGAQRDVEQKMEAIGTNLIVIRPAQVQRLASRKTIAGVVTTLRLDDYEAVAGLPFVAAAAPDAERPVRAKSGRSITITKVLGTTPAYARVRNFRIRAGRFFDAEEDRVAVLGAQVAEALFGNADPIGAEVRVRGVIFDVIGVMEAKGMMPDGSNEDNEILVPIRTALRRVFNITWLSGIFITVDDPARMGEIGDLLRARHGREDFGIQNTTKFVAMQKRVVDSMTLLAAGIGGVALLVGGAGILALMMMSVKERTSEIGVRMAVGATPRDVLVQFLLEATLLAFGGWTIGVLLGALGAFAVAAFTEWKPAVPLGALLASAAMVLVAGLGFGVIPARQAALLPPMEALRSV
jgi:putative ABC transport system permease protein